MFFSVQCNGNICLYGLVSFSLQRVMKGFILICFFQLSCQQKIKKFVLIPETKTEILFFGVCQGSKDPGDTWYRM